MKSMMIWAVATVAIVCVLGLGANGQCGGNPGERDPSGCPPLPCKVAGCDDKIANTCRYANVACNTCSAFEGAVADFLFLIDGSGSMDDNIAAVRDGLTRFVQYTPTIGLDAQFAVVMFGFNSLDHHHLMQQMTGNAAQVISVLDWMVASTTGGWEPALEGIWMATNTAPYRQYYTDTIARYPSVPNVSPGNIDIAWRSGFKNIIVLTDEDSDTPYNNLNRGGSPQALNPKDANCQSGDFQSSYKPGWANEVANVASAVIAGDFRLYMFMDTGSSSMCSSRQFGNLAAAVQWDDFTHFSRELTLQNYRLYSAAQQLSLQPLMLEAGKVARTYRVGNIGSDSWVDNFFLSMLDETKLCDPCISSTCVANTCVDTPLCSDGDPCTTDQCNIDGSGQASCAFTPITCVDPPGACYRSRCNPLSGVCDIQIPTLCTDQPPTPCKEYRCDPTDGGQCKLFDRICPQSTDECFVTSCQDGIGCVDERTTDLENKPQCRVPSVCEEPCGPMGNCSDGICACRQGWSGQFCYVPPCNASCGANGTCVVGLLPACEGVPERETTPDCYQSYCECPGDRVVIPKDNAVPGDDLCFVPPPGPSPSIINETTVAIGATVAVLAIIAAVVLAFILWRVRKLQTEIAELDAFAGADTIGDNPLFKEKSGWQVNAIAD